MSTLKSKQQKTLVSSKTKSITAKTSSSVAHTKCANQPTKRIVQNFLLVWLDPNIDRSNENCQKTLKQLRSIVNTIYTFTDPTECINFFDQIYLGDVFLLVSSSLGPTILPDIHEKSHLNSIYIFCQNKNQQENWVKKWTKIKCIDSQLSSIIESLKKDIKQCNQDSIAFSFVSNTNKTSGNLDHLEPSFMYTQIFKEILFELEYNKDSLKDLVNYCRQQYDKNSEELKIINEFESTYRSESSIWWYTRECFTYQMLNRALRTLEYDIIINMGFFICDLHNQIAELHSQQFDRHQTKSFTVYRGQGLSFEDFHKLEKTKGGLISFNNFLSTSKQQKISLAFAQSALGRIGSVGILFTITINPSTSSTPFALIDRISYFNDEQEILFSMHTIFRISEIKKIHENKQLYDVSLILTSDNDQELQTLTEEIRKETSPNEKGWYRMGELLLKLGQFDKAEQVYSTVLQQTLDIKDQGNIYYQLGRIKSNQGNNEEALVFYQKALEIDQQNLSEDHQSLAEIYNNIGAVYDNMSEWSKARSYYEKALKINKKKLPPNHPDLATLYNNIGLLCDNMEEYSNALQFYEKALKIKEQTLPSNHPGLATSYNNIATVYNYMKEYSKGLSFYEKTLDIQQKALPPNHPDLATTFNNIGWIYRNMKDYSKALVFYERALQIKQQILSPNHPSLQDVCQSIEICTKKLLNH